jgi:MOSC domain-containing protein YiiM
VFNVIGHGVTRVSDEIRAKRPTAHWTLGQFIGIFLSKKRRASLMRRLTGTDRNAEGFRHSTGI